MFLSQIFGKNAKNDPKTLFEAGRHLWPNYDTLDFKILTQCVKLLG